MSLERFDVVVIGGGMAGVSAAYYLSEHGRVLLVEREAQLAYHTTGRSAAMYIQTYGNAVIRALTVASGDFFREPPAGFTSVGLLRPRGALHIARADQLASLQAMLDSVSALVPGAVHLDPDQARALVPVLRADYLAAAVLEPDAMDLDVHAIHQGFLRGLRARGGQVATRAEVGGLASRAGGLRVRLRGREVEAPVVVNAAGAWGDELAALAGARPVGLVPRRRTAILFPPPPETDIAGWPACIDVDESFYFKPDAGALLGSPADETPSAPCDARPEDIDVAVAAERIQQATTLGIEHITHRWAGLRSFVGDKTPVVGFDPEVAGFFWLVGQGGYGIQTAPSMGRVAASLALGAPMPDDLQRLGLSPAALSPARLAR